MPFCTAITTTAPKKPCPLGPSSHPEPPLVRVRRRIASSTPGKQPPKPSPPQPGKSRSALLQHLLRLIDLRRQVRAPAAIGMVQQHQCAMRLADFVLGDGSLTVYPVSFPHSPEHIHRLGRKTHLSDRIN